jgi:hypothetical protein
MPRRRQTDELTNIRAASRDNERVTAEESNPHAAITFKRGKAVRRARVQTEGATFDAAYERFLGLKRTKSPYSGANGTNTGFLNRSPVRRKN